MSAEPGAEYGIISPLGESVGSRRNKNAKSNKSVVAVEGARTIERGITQLESRNRGL